MNSADIKLMTDNQLIQRTEYLVSRERKIVECIIWHLQEIQERKLFIQMEYSSMFECLVKHFKYSEAVAYARMSALRIISEVPAVAEALGTGEINLTNLTLSPTADLPFDRVNYLDKDHVQIQITANKRILEKIEYLKSLISHENLSPSYEDLLSLSVDAAIEKVEKKKGICAPALKKATPTKTNSNNTSDSTHSFAVKNSRYVPRNVKRFVLGRSQNQCEHVHSNGERCASKFQTQFDHIQAYSKGGKATLHNMQMLCRVHNNEKGSS